MTLTLTKNDAESTRNIIIHPSWRKNNKGVTWQSEIPYPTTNAKALEDTTR